MNTDGRLLLETWWEEWAFQIPSFTFHYIWTTKEKRKVLETIIYHWQQTLIESYSFWSDKKNWRRHHFNYAKYSYRLIIVIERDATKE